MQLITRIDDFIINNVFPQTIAERYKNLVIFTTIDSDPGYKETKNSVSDSNDILVTYFIILSSVAVIAESFLKTFKI